MKRQIGPAQKKFIQNLRKKKENEIFVRHYGQ